MAVEEFFGFLSLGFFALAFDFVDGRPFETEVAPFGMVSAELPAKLAEGHTTPTESFSLVKAVVGIGSASATFSPWIGIACKPLFNFPEIKASRLSATL